MDSEKVSAGIEQLVDHLRNNQSVQVDLGDIAGVTEILLATMRNYFNSIDTTLYSEFRGLSEYIQRARTEISELRPNDLKQEKIPRAGLELEAIVSSTETATGTIMDAAEEIMAADPEAENYVEGINEACMRIFEACSFQDITGQRITKVVSTLTYIEERLHGLQDAWGPDIEDAEGDAPEVGGDEDARPDQDLLNGPALDGEGIQQDQVDDLFGEPVAAGAIEISVETETNAIGPAIGSEADARYGHENETDEAGVPADSADGANGNGKSAKDLNKPAKKVADEPKLDDIVPLTPGANESASQDDIDALFD
jgi:chemotaxis protein CheZ